MGLGLKDYYDWGSLVNAGIQVGGVAAAQTTSSVEEGDSQMSADLKTLDKQQPEGGQWTEDDAKAALEAGGQGPVENTLEETGTPDGPETGKLNTATDLGTGSDPSIAGTGGPDSEIVGVHADGSPMSKSELQELVRVANSPAARSALDRRIADTMRVHNAITSGANGFGQASSGFVNTKLRQERDAEETAKILPAAQHDIAQRNHQ